MADVLAVRDEYRAQSWAMVIQECSASGLSNREFCRQRGISEKSFYYWLRKLRGQMAERPHRSWFRWNLWQNSRICFRSSTGGQN